MIVPPSFCCRLFCDFFSLLGGQLGRPSFAAFKSPQPPESDSGRVLFRLFFGWRPSCSFICDRLGELVQVARECSFFSHTLV